MVASGEFPHLKIPNEVVSESGTLLLQHAVEYSRVTLHHTSSNEILAHLFKV